MRKFLLALIFVGLFNLAHASLNQYLRPSDKRYGSFKMAKKLIKKRGLKTWVETGTSRNGACNCQGDGCSTMIFSDYLQDLPGELYSVDIDPVAVEACFNAVNYSKDRVHVFCQDSVSFLADFQAKIDFLYLDSYDFDVNNPRPSQEHHLKEIKAAYKKLHKNSVVMIDDCDLPHGGKGKLAIEYLKNKGWKKVYNGYQVIMVKK